MLKTDFCTVPWDSSFSVIRPISLTETQFTAFRHLRSMWMMEAMVVCHQLFLLSAVSRNVYVHFLVVHKIQTIQQRTPLHDTENVKTASTLLTNRNFSWRAPKVDSRLYCYQSGLPSENKHRKWHCCLGSQHGWEQHLAITHLVPEGEKSARWNQSYMSNRLLKMPVVFSAHLTDFHLAHFIKIHMFICFLRYYLSRGVHSMRGYRYIRAI